MTRQIKRTVVLVAGLLAVTGCGSGLNAQTYGNRDLAGSTNEDTGPLSVRHAYIETPLTAQGYAEGSEATMVLTITSRSREPDALVSASSPLAASIELPDEGVPIEAGGIALGVELILTGLAEELRSSEYVPVTLVFASGLTSELSTPVATSNEPPEERPGFQEPETDSNGDPLPQEEESTPEQGADVDGGVDEVEPAASPEPGSAPAMD